MKKFFKQLAADFHDKEYAHSYMESHSVSRLAAQVHALRKQRGWSQQDLSRRSGIAQERISKIESADFDSLTMKTLQKLSRAFDVHLHVAFTSFSDGIVDIGDLHAEQLQVPARDENLATAFSDRRECISGGSYSVEVKYKQSNNNRSISVTKFVMGADSPRATSAESERKFYQFDLIRKAETLGASDV